MGEGWGEGMGLFKPLNLKNFFLTLTLFRWERGLNGYDQFAMYTFALVLNLRLSV
jgi:hypothetical protein